MSASANFTQSLIVCDNFSDSLDNSKHIRVPDDWWVAVSDVVGSRKAIADGKYKAVNMAGVAMISAIMNALGHYDVAYIFGGDGAAVAISPDDKDAVTDALSKTVTWARENLDLELRAALIDVKSIRTANADIKIGAVRVSDAVNNFAFSGGGVALAEKWMKEGKYKIEPAPAGAMPDLSGLSCRWTPVEPDGRNIVSIIIEPAEGHGDQFAGLAGKFLQICKPPKPMSENPMPENGPGFTWPPAGLDLEARATRGDKPLSSQKRLLYVITLLAWVLDKTGIPLGPFSPKRYRQYTALNTDYRKFQDGLRMTLSLSNGELTQLKSWLENHRSKSELKYGLCVQDSAVLTCFVPSISSDQHFHFLDGAGGGYAEAATNMKT